MTRADEDRDRPGPEKPEKPGGAQGDGHRLGRHVRVFLRLLGRASNRRRIYVICFFLVAVVSATTVGQLRLNEWQRDFYDALSGREFNPMLRQIAVFGVLVAALVTLGVAQTWLRETLKIELRDAVTCDLVKSWMRPRRAYLLGWAGDVGRNPDQRIHEDAKHYCELTADLGTGLLQATLLLISFIGVLWELSGHVSIHYGGRTWSVPGYLAWCALAYALVGSWATWRVGRPLVALDAERYAREADLRFNLVRVNDSAEEVAVLRGEREERRRIGEVFTPVLSIMRDIARGLANLNWVTSTYGWLALVVPIVAAAPGYFNGTMTFGELMMVSGAFLQVQNALRWYVDNFAGLADWRATLLRIMALRICLPGLGSICGPRMIDHVPHPEGKLALRSLRVELPEGRQVTFDQGDVELDPGERLLVVGGPGSGRAMTFRAVAGLWPRGHGEVLLPPERKLAFLPQSTYTPLGTLRSVLAYPGQAADFGDEEARLALECVGLDRLAEELDAERRWDKTLAEDELQALAFARLLLRRPEWVVMNDPLHAINPKRREKLLGIFDRELKGTAVLCFSGEEDPDHLFGKITHLVESKASPIQPGEETTCD